MKQLLVLLALTIASTAFAAEPAKKEPAKKAEKCVPSKEVVCQDSLKGKERPTPKKKKEETTK
jgi:hypothetical protein